MSEQGKVFFHPIEGTGSLTISWSSGPKGDAVEAKKGAGVGFFSDKGDLLCVIFDEVKSSQDHQTLHFDGVRVDVTVKNGRVAHSVSSSQTPPIKIRKRPKKSTKV